MAESAGKVLEGVFAITKPPNLSSAQVLRDLQHAFKTSKTFQPLLSVEEQKLHKNRSKRRRIDNDNVFKMGHGGTLDPMATGVLIVGIGRGTKSLQDFLYCTKTYETVVLFGKSTDTYDVAGKIVATAPTAQITRDLVESKLSSFRGRIKQVPPIYSALKINGMKGYEYARSGKELPREFEAREMEVSECILTDWHDAGSHSYRWPAEEVAEEDKKTFQQLLRIGEASTAGMSYASHTEESDGAAASTTKAPNGTSAEDAVVSPKKEKASSREETAALHTHIVPGLSEVVADAPAARIRLTVSSGFYVRSFAHDLGIACNSYGTMSELGRTRQADFTTASPVQEGLVPALEYADLQKGEDVWGPKITEILETWLVSNPISNPPSHYESKGASRHDRGKSDWRGRRDDRRMDQASRQKRRNSSSPE